MGTYPEILYNWFIMQSDEKREFLSSCAVCCVFSVRIVFVIESLCQLLFWAIIVAVYYTADNFLWELNFVHVVVCKKNHKKFIWLITLF